MKGVLVAALLAVPPGDGWFGRDKLKHFLVSAFLQSASYAAIQAAGGDRTTALAGASLLTAGAGVGKELADRRSGRPFSARDLAWDAAGMGSATLLLLRTER